jgi:single-strand DNA-binding protein
VIVWGKRGEALTKLIAKGDRIGVEGRIQTRSYDDSDGKKRYWTEVVANNILLLGSRRLPSEFTAEASDSSEKDDAVEVLHGDAIPF